MDVVHLSAECYPVAKVGGLGDVVGALPKYLQAAGVNSSVVLPYYDRKFTRENKFKKVHSSSITLGNKRVDYTVLLESTKALGFDLYLIMIPGLLDRPEVYAYPDEIEQFIAFQVAFLDWTIGSKKKPDIIHCHDHHTGLVPFLASYSDAYKGLASIPTVLTIHNAQYQGWIGWDRVGLLPSFDLARAGLLDWNNCINSLAAGVKCCWRYTTVSPSYLAELSYSANGLERLFAMEAKKGSGIINGIDPVVWDPRTDRMIFSNYTPETVDAGKKENKKELSRVFKLSSSKPLVAFIGRLVGEKGADLLPGAVRTILETYPGKVSLLVLGSGDPAIETELQNISEKYPKHYGVHIGYDEELSHRIYASADFLLMPSRVEPCGLNQLYAVRYGTMPVVHSTGGLKDTVTDLEDDMGYGIRFNELTEQALVQAVGRSIGIYKKTKTISGLKKRMMLLDFSWDNSAKQYIHLYHGLINPA